MNQQIADIAFENAIDPMWVIDVVGESDYRFVAVNQTFTTITGWQKARVIGQPMEAIVPASSHALVHEKYRLAIDTGEQVDYVEESMHPAGIKYGYIRVVPVKGADGKVCQLLGIAHDITDKTLLEAALVRERDHKHQQITAAAIRGQELERSRVSRELHDNVNQVLTTVKLYTELCLDGQVDYREVLPKCVNLLVASITEIRTLSKQLSAPSLGGMNFQETISDLAESVRQTSGIDVQISFDLDDCAEMDAELHLTIYRVLQEQFTNIQKYANASRVDIALRAGKGELCLNITDDGVGFDMEQKSKGIGLLNMRSRTHLLHGSFMITSEPGSGTEVEVCFPVKIEEGICLPAYA